MGRRMRGIGGVIALAVGLVACGGGGAGATAPAARTTLIAYRDALRRGDPGAAWVLLDEPSQRATPRERFAALATENRGEVEELLRDLDARSVDVRARVRLADGEDVVLVQEDGEWKIASGVIDAEALREPEDAVRALRRALRRRSLSAFLRVLSRDMRAEVEGEMRRVLDHTADEADFEIEVRGDAAEMRTSSGAVIRLVREAGEWRVQDVE